MWTKTPPSKPGFYFYRSQPGDDETVAQVHLDLTTLHPGLQVSFHLMPGLVSLERWCKVLPECEWQGPLHSEE